MAGVYAPKGAFLSAAGAVDQKPSLARSKVFRSVTEPAATRPARFRTDAATGGSRQDGSPERGLTGGASIQRLKSADGLRARL